MFETHMALYKVFFPYEVKGKGNLFKTTSLFVIKIIDWVKRSEGKNYSFFYSYKSKTELFNEERICTLFR